MHDNYNEKDIDFYFQTETHFSVNNSAENLRQNYSKCFPNFDVIKKYYSTVEHMEVWLFIIAILLTIYHKIHEYDS